jgi:hypothetical protein
VTPSATINIGLQDVEDILFQHPAVFVHAAIVLSSCDRNTHQAVQLGQFIESVAQPRFFQPEAVQTLEFSSSLKRAAEIPHHFRLPLAEGLRLVGVDHNFHTRRRFITPESPWQP